MGLAALAHDETDDFFGDGELGAVAALPDLLLALGLQGSQGWQGWQGWPPPSHRVTASTTRGCSLHQTGLQPPPHGVAASTTRGCSLVPGLQLGRQLLTLVQPPLDISLSSMVSIVSIASMVKYRKYSTMSP